MNRVSAICEGFLLFLGVICYSSSASFGLSPDLTLRELVQRVRAVHPIVKLGEANQKGAEAQISASQANYFPTLELNAVYTEGFPAGIINLSGIPGAAFRSGPAAGLVLKQSIWDFGRTQSAVEVAQANHELKKAESEVLLNQVTEGVIRNYFDCIRWRELSRSWEELEKEFKVLLEQVHSFVQSGQRSKVEELLAQSQFEDARTKADDYLLKYRESKLRLSQILQLQNADLECPYLGESTRKENDTEVKVKDSPFAKLAQSEVILTQAQVGQSKANINPKLFGLASIGVMQNESAGPKTYSVGIGLIAPLFDSFRNKHETQNIEAQLQAKEAKAQLVTEQLNEMNSKLRELMKSSELKLDRLKQELEVSLSGLELAKKRYSLMQGKLVDLREALRNVSQIKSSLTDVRTEYHLSLALIANLNNTVE